MTKNNKKEIYAISFAFEMSGTAFIKAKDLSNAERIFYNKCEDSKMIFEGHEIEKDYTILVSQHIDTYLKDKDTDKALMELLDQRYSE